MKAAAAITLYLVTFSFLLCGIVYFVIAFYNIQAESDSSRILWLLNPDQTIPGLAIEPRLDKSSPLLWFSARNATNNQNLDYVDFIERRLRSYPDEMSSSAECQNAKSRPSDVDISQWLKFRYGYANSCPFSVKSLLGPCAERNFGYDRKLQPCLYITINKIPGWIPIGFSKRGEIPKDIPQKLQLMIMETLKNLNDSTHSGPDRAWIWCQGKFPHDNEHMEAIEYYPHPWIEAHYFPYIGQLDYDQPMVAIKIINPKLDTLIAIRCNLYTANLVNPPSYLNSENDFNNPSLRAGKPGSGYSEIHLYLSKTK